MHCDVYEGEQQTDVALTKTSQVAAATQTDEDVTAGEQFQSMSMEEMIYQFLSHTIDTKNSKLTDKLVTRNVLSPRERKAINDQRKIDDKVNSLMVLLRGKSGSEFESFLTALGETGQQSIADVVRIAVDAVGRTGQNPLQLYTHMVRQFRRIFRHHRQQLYLSKDWITTHRMH